MQLAGGVSAAQLKLMALEEAAVAVKPPGAEGTAVQDAPPPLPSMRMVASSEGTFAV